MNAVEEKTLRVLVREAIKHRMAFHQQQPNEEDQLRQIIRHLITEVDADTEPAPYESTALNALADAFNQILPVIKSGLRKLKKPEERKSYRAHILQKFDSIFANFEGLDQKDKVGEGPVNEQEDEVTIKIDNRPDDAMVVPDIEKDRFEPDQGPEDPDEKDVQDLAIGTEDPTGARFAFSTINNSNIEKLLNDKRKLLDSPEYRQEFKEYALYNIDLWLLTYEKELADELGTEPAFTETIMSKPADAEVTGGAEEFEASPDLEDDIEDEVEEDEGAAIDLPSIAEFE
jgi:hypothetical protein